MAAEATPAFGDVLKQYRQAAGLTQEELAARAGLSTRGLSDLERGLRRTPRRATVQCLARALGLPAGGAATLEAACHRGGSSRGTATTAVQLAGPPLVGRRAELALLEQHLDGPGPTVLLLAGEPGIGKTRLLAEAARLAKARGWSVFEGRSPRQGGSLPPRAPFGPILEAVAGYLQGLSPAQVRLQLQGCGWLVRLLPELAERWPRLMAEPPSGSLAPEQERRLMYQAVQRLLANAAGPAGTLLLLDDLHWAGADSFDLLTVLVQPTGRRPLVVMGAYRTTELQPRDALSATLADLAHAGLAAHRALGPLTHAEARRLLASLLDDVPAAAAAQKAVWQRVVQRAGGVPFFLVSWAQALRQGALGAEDAVPWSLRQGICQRVEALPAVARELLDLLAIAGGSLPRALLVSASACREEEVLAALEAACHARLLEEDRPDGVYRFAHEVIREVVEAQIGVARQATLHRRMAEALEVASHGLSVEALAGHFARGGAAAQAIYYLELAGDRARSRYAHAAAEGWYGDLVQLVDQLGRGHDAARAREKLGAVLAMAARHGEALEVLERAAQMYEAAGDEEGLRRVLAEIGRAHGARGTLHEGVERLQCWLAERQPTAPSPGLAALCAVLARLLFVGGRHGDALQVAERAAALARAVGDDRLLAEAELRRGTALVMVGRIEEGVRVLQAAVPLAEGAGDLTTLGWLLNNLATVYEMRGQFAPCHRHRQRALQVARQCDDAVQIASLSCGLGVVAFLSGEWVQARHDLEQALLLSRRVKAAAVIAYALRALGQLSLAAGEDDTATRYLEECTALATTCGNAQAQRFAQLLLAEHDLLAGRAGAARARLAPLLDRPDMPEQERTHILPFAAWAHLELGELAAASAMAREATRRARAAPTQAGQLALVDALWAEALVGCRGGQWEEAAAAIAEGLRLTRPMPYPYAEARFLHLAGQLPTHMTLPSGLEALQAALRIFERLGARRDGGWVEHDIVVLAARGDTSAGEHQRAAVLASPELEGISDAAPVASVERVQ